MQNLIYKDGANKVVDNERLIEIETEDKAIFTFTPKIKARLLEINSNIFTNPELINNSVKCDF